jgi:hypothetical protein
VSGTRETLPRTAIAVICEPISPKGEMVNCGKGVGEGGSTDEVKDSKTLRREAPLLCSRDVEEVRVSECSKYC